MLAKTLLRLPETRRIVYDSADRDRVLGSRAAHRALLLGIGEYRRKDALLGIRTSEADLRSWNEGGTPCSIWKSYHLVTAMPGYRRTEVTLNLHLQSLAQKRPEVRTRTTGNSCARSVGRPYARGLEPFDAA